MFIIYCKMAFVNTFIRKNSHLGTVLFCQRTKPMTKAQRATAKLKVENGKLKILVQTPTGFVPIYIYKVGSGEFFVWGLTFSGWTYIIGAR